MQSPERLQARLEELAGGVEKERGLVADAERRARDLQARMDTIAKVCPCYLCCLTPLTCGTHHLWLLKKVAVHEGCIVLQACMEIASISTCIHKVMVIIDT